MRFFLIIFIILLTSSAYANTYSIDGIFKYKVYHPNFDTHLYSFYYDEDNERQNKNNIKPINIQCDEADLIHLNDSTLHSNEKYIAKKSFSKKEINKNFIHNVINLDDDLDFIKEGNNENSMMNTNIDLVSIPIHIQISTEKSNIHLCFNHIDAQKDNYQLSFNLTQNHDLNTFHALPTINNILTIDTSLSLDNKKNTILNIHRHIYLTSHNNILLFFPKNQNNIIQSIRLVVNQL